MISFEKIYDLTSRFYKNVKEIVQTYRKIILIWLSIFVFVALGVILGLDNAVITFSVLIFGLVSQAFIGLLNLIALIPVVGPIVAKVLALPIYWILNALGYFLSIIAIKKGHSRAVFNYRILTIAFLIGVAFGFILGKLI